MSASDNDWFFESLGGNTMETSRFFHLVHEADLKTPGSRHGQNAWNVAVANGLDVDDLRDTYADPFHDDKHMAAFIAALTENGSLT